MKNFTFSRGMDISFEILKRLKKDTRLKKIEVSISTFTNCRESGLTYMVENKNGVWFTFCTYEHRNSDQIIINGKEGYLTVFNDNILPYCADSKWEYLATADYEEYDDATKKLADLIIKWSKNNKKT